MLEFKTFLFLFTTALVFCAILYMKPNARYMRASLRKAGSLLLYAYWKICLNITCGIELLKPKVKRIFTHYQSPIQEDQKIQHMQQHINRLKSQMAEESGFEHQLHSVGYNLKLLK